MTDGTWRSIYQQKTLVNVSNSFEIKTNDFSKNIFFYPKETEKTFNVALQHYTALKKDRIRVLYIMVTYFPFWQEISPHTVHAYHQYSFAVLWLAEPLKQNLADVYFG